MLPLSYQVALHQYTTLAPEYARCPRCGALSPRNEIRRRSFWAPDCWRRPPPDHLAAAKWSTAVHEIHRPASGDGGGELILPKRRAPPVRRLRYRRRCRPWPGRSRAGSVGSGSSRRRTPARGRGCAAIPGASRSGDDAPWPRPGRPSRPWMPSAAYGRSCGGRRSGGRPTPRCSAKWCPVARVTQLSRKGWLYLRNTVDSSGLARVTQLSRQWRSEAANLVDKSPRRA